MSNSIRTDLTAKLVGQCGDDLWGSCAQFPVSDWKQEVEAGDTILGYWEWVIAQAEANGVDLDLLYGGAGKLAALERFAEMFDWSEEEARHELRQKERPGYLIDRSHLSVLSDQP